ncbi:hypothetical protein [Pseudomonas fulva]|uniref:hypothetical protein n=1 Tax=Pseudomonas fulva TaxID=47880 RepID=UPI0034CD3B61
MSQAKERPILFSAPMVRAILEGRKTVTRRAVKIQPRTKGDIGSYGLGQPFIRHPDPTKRSPECPYGRPGNRLWVRETWLEDPEDDGTWAYTQYMGCKGSPLSDIPKRFQKPEHCIFRASWEGPDMLWRPSIHMPRWASRILLEITSVRVEQLQDISEEQALAEGVRLYTDHAELGDWYHVEGIETYSASPRKSFELLWQQINGVDAWYKNPWVWVVEFKVVEPGASGCDYHDSHFGASYPDAQCVDGFLWDEDSCDAPGGPLLSGGDIPCPKCNAEAYADHQREMSQ